MHSTTSQAIAPANPQNRLGSQSASANTNRVANILKENLLTVVRQYHSQRCRAAVGCRELPHNGDAFPAFLQNQPVQTRESL
jgi:hypothetical protein